MRRPAVRVAGPGGPSSSAEACENERPSRSCATVDRMEDSATVRTFDDQNCQADEGRSRHPRRALSQDAAFRTRLCDRLRQSAVFARWISLFRRQRGQSVRADADARRRHALSARLGQQDLHRDALRASDPLGQRVADGRRLYRSERAASDQRQPGRNFARPAGQLHIRAAAGQRHGRERHAAVSAAALFDDGHA